MTRRLYALVGVTAVAFWLGGFYGGMSYQRGTDHAQPAARCYAERSSTREGVEIIAYPPGRARTVPGVRVACPK